MLTTLYALICIVCYIFASQDSSAWFTTQWIVYYFPPVRLIDFSIGCLSGALFFKNKDNRVKKIKVTTVATELVISIIIVLSWIIYAGQYGILGSQAFRFSLLFMPTSVMLILLLAEGSGILSWILESKILVTLGDVSPFTFLIHGVVIKYCNVFFRYFDYHNTVVATVVSFLLTIVAALAWKSSYEKGLGT